jgi:hypothetical protein
MQAKRVGMIGYGLEISEYVGYWLTIASPIRAKLSGVDFWLLIFDWWLLRQFEQSNRIT